MSLANSNSNESYSTTEGLNKSFLPWAVFVRPFVPAMWKVTSVWWLLSYACYFLPVISVTVGDEQVSCGLPTTARELWSPLCFLLLLSLLLRLLQSADSCATSTLETSLPSADHTEHSYMFSSYSEVPWSHTCKRNESQHSQPPASRLFHNFSFSKRPPGLGIPSNPHAGTCLLPEHAWEAGLCSPTPF